MKNPQPRERERGEKTKILRACVLEDSVFVLGEIKRNFAKIFGSSWVCGRGREGRKNRRAKVEIFGGSSW